MGHPGITGETVTARIVNRVIERHAGDEISPTDRRRTVLRALFYG